MSLAVNACVMQQSGSARPWRPKPTASTEFEILCVLHFPSSIVHLYAYKGRLTKGHHQQPLQLAMVKVGINKHLFEILAAGQGKGLSNAALAEKTSIDPALLSMSQERKKDRSFGVCH